MNIAYAVLLLMSGDFDIEGRYQGMRLTDAIGFGVDASVAGAHWRNARDHCSFFEEMSYGWLCGCEWRCDANWCRHCWDCLDDVLGGTTKQALHQRLYRMNQLRAALGEEAWASKRMPGWAPGWYFGGEMPYGIVPPSKR